MAKRTTNEEVLDILIRDFDRVWVTRADKKVFNEKYNLSLPYTLFEKPTAVSFERGKFYVDPNVTELPNTPKIEVESNIQEFENIVPLRKQPENRNQTEVFEERILPPEVDPLYIAWGNHVKITKIVKSEKHYPTFITGLSGNGKTMTVEQACAKAKRKLVVVNITEETDEDDLIGGFRLQDGDTVFKYGPVIQAMKEGAVLLLDEIDLASHKIMALQSIVDGKGYFIKKTGEFIKPEKGFNVIATANTKGRGDDNGMFAGTNILNEAFLERFAKYIPQGYPSKSVETKILTSLLKYELDDTKELDDKDTTFIKNLVDWSDVIRAAFNDGGVDNLITTRRLALAIKGYVIFDKDVTESIDGAVERFDEDTASAFRELFDTVREDDYDTNDDDADQPSHNAE